MFEGIDVACLILVKHALQIEDTDERSGHFTVPRSHEPISALQTRKDLALISIRSQTRAAIVFGEHCGAPAKREFDTAYFALRGLEVGAGGRDAALIAVPETKM